MQYTTITPFVNTVYVTCMSDYRRGLDLLTTRLVTTRNYSAIANLHTSQISTAQANSFQSALSSPVVTWQRLLSVESLQLLRSLSCPLAFNCTDQVLSSQTPLHLSQLFKVKVKPSASLSWNEAPIWGLWPDFYYCQTVAGLLMWGALSDERAGLSFTIAAGLHQRSHCRVRVPWYSRLYFSVSDSILPFSSPPSTHRITVEVFDFASTRELSLLLLHLSSL
jgi:hypothetical protein